MSIDLFKSELSRISKKLKCEPNEVSKIEFNSETVMTEWQLRKIGGYVAARSFVYPKTEVGDKHIQGMKFVNAFRNKIAKKQSIDEYLKDEFLDVFKDHLNKHPLLVHKNTKKKSKGVKKERALIVHVSDTHFGANIDQDEMGNVNKFTWEIAARRMALLAEQVVEYKPQYRDETELVICINGDIIAGVIHDQEWFSDLLTKQFSGTLKILIQFVSYCAKYFPNVRVVCTPGNHGRAMHKVNKSRATTHKWDSYETMIYVALKEALERNTDNIKVEVPKTPYAILNILGHRGFVTHGDTVMNVGNPGRSINMKSINTQINSLNASKLATSKFDFIMCGHVHVNCVQITDNGAVMVINGTLSGADPFCQSIGIFGNEPSQTIFEVTKAHAVGDIRMVKLKSADDLTYLDKIISPPVGDL